MTCDKQHNTDYYVESLVDILMEMMSLLVLIHHLGNPNSYFSNQAARTSSKTSPTIMGRSYNSDFNLKCIKLKITSKRYSDKLKICYSSVSLYKSQYEYPDAKVSQFDSDTRFVLAPQVRYMAL